jgi:hypothetical protein
MEAALTLVRVLEPGPTGEGPPDPDRADIIFAEPSVSILLKNSVSIEVASLPNFQENGSTKCSVKRHSCGRLTN